MCAVLSCSVVSLCDLMDYSPPGSSVYGYSLGKDTGLSCHALLQGIFLTQGLNLCLLCLLHWEVSSLPLMPRWKLYWPTLGLNSKCFQGCIPSGGPKEESVSCLLQIPEATPISWPVGLSLSSKPATLGWVFFKMPSLQFPTARILLLFSH